VIHFLAVLVAGPFLNSTQIYWMCTGWLKLAVRGGQVILGIRNEVIGWENLPLGQTVTLAKMPRRRIPHGRHR
jgi:1-acyl-sn-glycerol-3-phosphate acyltransferase